MRELCDAHGKMVVQSFALSGVDSVLHVGAAKKALAEADPSRNPSLMSLDVNPDDEFHVVKADGVMALSLEELDAAYQRDSISEETLIWQEGLVEWMRLDTLLAALEEQDGPIAPAPPLPEDVYHVMVAPEEVKQMSLDLLADAYRLDVINDETLVWQTGFTEWLPLSLLIGPEPESHVSIAPSLPPSAGGYSIGSATAPRSVAAVSQPSSASSLAPASYWLPPEAPQSSPWWGRSLVALAFIGAGFVSYRNGWVETALRDSGQGRYLAQFEAKIGEPSIETPVGLQRYLRSLGEAHGLAQLAETDPVPKAETPAEAKPNADEPEAKEAASGEAADQAAPVGEAKANAAKAVEEKAAKEAKGQGAAAAAFGNSLSGKTPAVRAAPAKRRSFTPKKYKGPSGDPNDPMNGSL